MPHSQAGSTRPSGVADDPFPDAETAWFRCMRMGPAAADAPDRGADPPGTSGLRTAAEVSRVLRRLVRDGRLGPGHMRVLLHYGLQSLPPSAEAVVHRRLWTEALDRLEQPLRRKGIVA